MKSAELHRVSRFSLARAFFMCSFAGLLFVSPAYPHQLDGPVALDKTKSMAATQHEIVMLLIQKKEYEKALAEANKIFGMKWPNDQESLLLKEMLFVTGQFISHGQAPLGLELIEKNAKCFKTPSSQIAIWKEKGYLYKTMKQTDRALDCFEKARKLGNCSSVRADPVRLTKSARSPTVGLWYSAIFPAGLNSPPPIGKIMKDVDPIIPLISVNQ
jgi:tetratricopeptide (TPR) repeat protein